MASTTAAAIARPASTVILVAPFQFFNPSKNSFKSNYRIFMVKRSYESKFMSGTCMAQQYNFNKNQLKITNKYYLLGAYVFPGGAVEKTIDASFGAKFSDQTFRVCAVREAFEESGIALFNGIKDYGTLPSWRHKVHNSASELLNFCKEQQCTPDVDSLIPFAHWITPLQEQKRFDTYFYLANCSSFVQLQGVESIVHDGSETVNSKWFAPEEIISEFEQGKLYLAPPTWLILNELAQHSTLEHLIAHYSSPSVQLAKQKQGAIQPTILKPNKDQQTIQEQVYSEKGLQGLKDSLIIAMPGDMFHHESAPNCKTMNRIEIGRVEGRMTYKHVTSVNHQSQLHVDVPAKM